MSALVFNLDYLNAIFDGNRTAIVEVIDLFIEELPLAKENMESAIKENNAEASRKAAHKIKSSLRAIGASEIAEIAARIEYFSEADYNRIPGLWKEFRELLPELENQLSEFLKEQK